MRKFLFAFAALACAAPEAVAAPVKKIEPKKK